MSDHMCARPVGRVVGLWRYPVKSMAAEPLTQAGVSWHGLAGDRRWAFIREGAARSGFPWLTLRERPDMSHYVPWLEDPADPERSPVKVRTPSGAVHDILDPVLAAELHPPGARVIRQHRGIFDTMPLSLITAQSVAALGGLVDMRMDVLRFRPNIVVEAADAGMFAEDGWVGCTLRLGGLRMRVDQRDSRCAVITIDPVTLARAPRVLRAVARQRQGCIGVYGSTVRPGQVAVGDPVLIETAEARMAG